MLRLIIIFLAILVKASFSKISGDGFIEYQLFPFSDLKMIWPIYLWHITFYFSFAALAWELFLQEVKYKFEIKVFALLMTGELLDFILRCNQSFFHVFGYAFSYDSFMFLVFGIILTKRLWKTSRLVY